MEREFNYNDISIADIEANKHLTFVCDADTKKAIIESEDYEENF